MTVEEWQQLYHKALADLRTQRKQFDIPEGASLVDYVARLKEENVKLKEQLEKQQCTCFIHVGGRDSTCPQHGNKASSDAA